MKGFGTVVTGTLVSGASASDDELVVQPRRAPVKVRGMQVHGPSAEAVAGQRTAINLGGVEVGDVSRGETLAAPDAERDAAIDAEIDLLPSAKPLKHGARVRVHNGTSKCSGASRSPARRRRGLPPGVPALVRVRLESPAVLTRGDRFIIRAYSPPMTIGGGVVLDPAPTRPASVQRRAAPASSACAKRSTGRWPASWR